MLSTKKIASLKTRFKRYTISDGNGLCLRVHPSGVKSFVFRNYENGKVRDITLGHFPDLSLTEARRIVREKRKSLNLSVPNSFTFNDGFKLWCGLKRGQIVSFRDEQRMLKRHLFNALGSFQIEEISAPLVLKVTEVLEKEGKRATRKRVLSRAREILDLSVCAGYLRHNPLSGISRLLPSPKVTHMPSIYWQELPRVMEVFKTAPKQTQLLFLTQLCLLLRPNEAVSLRWSWISGNVLTIPASKMKNRNPFRVPLSEKVLGILESQKALSNHPRKDLIFHGRSAALSSQTLSKFLHSSPLKGLLVAHGLRSIGRSWLADNGVSFEVAEACLAHVTGTQVSRAYQRSDFLSERIKCMADWAEFVSSCARCAHLLF